VRPPSHELISLHFSWILCACLSDLLQERAKGSDSFWAPYINSLPQVYGNMPIFFNDEMLAHLKGSFTLAKIRERIESLKAEYDNICAHVPALMKDFTHADFVWARLAVITRIFGLVIRGVKTDGLVAYADMLNHKKPRDAQDTDTRWTFDDSVRQLDSYSRASRIFHAGREDLTFPPCFCASFCFFLQLNGFTITTLRPIAKGEQVYDSTLHIYTRDTDLLFSCVFVRKPVRSNA
jgi:hypothetical protein